MTEEMTFGSVLRTIVGIGLMLAVLWTAAYLSGAWDMIFKADKTADAYGLPYLYENWQKNFNDFMTNFSGKWRRRRKDFYFRR